MGGQSAGKPDRVFVTHGEDKVTEILQKNCGTNSATRRWLRSPARYLT